MYADCPPLSSDSVYVLSKGTACFCKVCAFNSMRMLSVVALCEECITEFKDEPQFDTLKEARRKQRQKIGSGTRQRGSSLLGKFGDTKGPENLLSVLFYVDDSKSRFPEKLRLSLVCCPRSTS